MDNQEAIRILKREKNRYLQMFVDIHHQAEAFDIAIAALSNEITLDELNNIYIKFTSGIPMHLSNFDLQSIMNEMREGRCKLWRGCPPTEDFYATDN